MKKVFLKTKIIVVIWILSALLFSFLHSELGFLSHNENNHSEHDFCNLVDDSTPPTIKIVKINLILFKDFIKIKNKDTKFIAHCEKNDKKSLKESLKPKTNATILIGPEGDFSKKEIQMALDNKYLPISLGNTRLRTETAAIIACSQVAFVNES